MTMADTHCLAAMIAFAPERGFGFDSTFRNLNDNGAPLTAIVVCDPRNHLLPGMFHKMVLISG